MTDAAIIWLLLYTKPYAEEQAEVNLQRQGFATLLPLIRDGHRLVPLFPRYIFSGHQVGQPAAAMRSTFGVVDVVRWGERPARVPLQVIQEIRSRMDAHNIVRLSPRPPIDPLFAKTQRERVRALQRLVAAGFRAKVTG